MSSAQQGSGAQAPDLLSGPAPENEATTNYVSMEMGQYKSDSQYPGVPPVIDDDDDDQASASGSIVSSVMTADGIHDIEGFLVVCFVILIGDMSRGVFFPTLWPLISSLGGSTVTLGYAVAAFSTGRIVTSPMFGSMSVTMGYTKTLLLSVSVLLLGTMIYAQIQNAGSMSFLIVSQLILGFGSGTLGVTRAFVADVTAKRNRTQYMFLITAVQYGGFTVTPFVGAALTYIFGDAEYFWGPFRLNQYTSPAYFMLAICIFTLYCLVFHFKDRHRSPSQKKAKVSSRQAAVDEVATSNTCFGMLTVFDACILGCMLLNVATKGSIAAFETVGIAYGESHFALLSQEAGSIVATCGTFGVAALLSMGYLSSRFSDIQLICGGIIVMTVGIVSLAGFDEGVENPQWRYCMALFLIYAVGYPIGHTAVIGIFSKIVGRQPQGVLLGWFASAGSLARMLFPVMTGYVADMTDIVVMFYILAAVLSLATIFVLYCRPTLVLLSS